MQTLCDQYANFLQYVCNHRHSDKITSLCNTRVTFVAFASLFLCKSDVQKCKGRNSVLTPDGQTSAHLHVLSCAFAAKKKDNLSVRCQTQL